MRVDYNLEIKTDNLPKLKLLLVRMAKAQAKAGFPVENESNVISVIKSNGEPENRDGLTIAEYAAYNEFGTVHIPPRPFMRGAADNLRKKKKKIAEHITLSVEEGRISLEQGLHLLGELMVETIRDSIQNGKFAPLSQTTIDAKKGSAKTLIDTGAMIQSVAHIIELEKK